MSAVCAMPDPCAVLLRCCCRWRPRGKSAPRRCRGHSIVLLHLQRTPPSNNNISTRCRIQPVAAEPSCSTPPTLSNPRTQATPATRLPPPYHHPQHLHVAAVVGVGTLHVFPAAMPRPKATSPLLSLSLSLPRLPCSSPQRLPLVAVGRVQPASVTPSPQRPPHWLRPPPSCAAPITTPQKILRLTYIQNTPKYGLVAWF